MREEEPVRRPEVPLHPLGIDDEPLDDPGEAIEHVVECEERVRHDDALRRRVRDVALVPERHVLEADDRGRADDAREPGDPLGDLRVALVRHRRRALHAGGERLLDLAHLGAREVADLGREPIERRRADGKRREQLGMPVTGDHLGRHRVRLEPEAFAGDALDLGIDRGVRPDGARELADAARCRGRARAVRVPGRARRPSLRASSRRSSARRESRASGRCRPCAGAPRRAGRRRRARDRCPASRQLAGVPDLQRERGVDDIRRRQPVVHPAPLRPELLGDGVDERGEVVVGRQLDLRHSLGARRRCARRGSRPRRLPGRPRPRPSRRAPPARPRASAPASPPPTRSGSSPDGSSGQSPQPV